LISFLVKENKEMEATTNVKENNNFFILFNKFKVTNIKINV